MRVIARHYVDPDDAEQQEKRLTEEIPRFVDLAKREPSALQAVMKMSLQEAGYGCISDPDVTWIYTWDSFAMAMQAGSAVFVVAGQDDGEVEFRLGDDVVRVAAIGSSTQNDARTWLDALYLAMVFRDQKRIDFLTGVPIELLRSAGLRYDEYVYSLVRMWQACWRSADDLIEVIVDAMRTTDPDQVVEGSPRVALQLDWPVIEAFYHFGLREEAEFNEALARALTLHGEFWTKDDESEADPRGFVALGPLALACHAKDMGLPIDVASEFMPERLIAGSRLGERVL
jgi:hypothetical protein